MAKRGQAQNYDDTLLDEMVGEVEEIVEEEVDEAVETEEVDELDNEEVAADEGEVDADEGEAPAGDEVKADSDDDKAEEKQNRVPLSELIEERRKRQELESRLKKYDTLWERLEAIEKAKEEESKPQAPDYDEDPVGHLRHQQEQIAAQVNEVAQTTQQQREQAQQAQQIIQMQAAVTTTEQQFAKQHDDYYDAINHLRTVMRRQAEPMMVAQGITDPAQQAQLLQRQEAQAAMHWLQAGVNPAEYAYNYAKTVGYTPVDKSVDKSGVSRETSGDDEMARAEKGLKAAKGSGSGGSKKVDKGFVDTAEISEFNAAMDEMFGSMKS